MSPIFLGLLALVSVGALAFAFTPSISSSGRADKRRKAFQGEQRLARASTPASRNKDDRRKTVQHALDAQNLEMKKRKRRVPLQTKIFRAGMKTKTSAFIRNAIIFGILVFVVCLMTGVPMLFSLFFGAASGYVVPMWFLGFRTKRYQAKFLDELPNAVEAIVRGIKAGMPLNDSIRLVAKEVNEPVRSEFGRVVEQQAVGKSMMEAIQVLYERLPLSEVNFLVVVITVQQQAGGNLSEALSNLSRVLRDRKKMKAKIKAMSSEAKASGGIIGALPFLVAGVVSVASPSYLTPLFETTLGHIWIGIGAVMYATGTFIMMKMVKFEY